ncbi:Serine protease inhibitor [Drechslerella dactyloides]|uniref:Serine protease inhibitor n=1 Tax=Drechslerella dactyloides TaxID=74499 RepID=A0AAD6IPN4_DREDA|nr:Serine protease inhibitor [Drechslerella dactyloides]
MATWMSAQIRKLQPGQPDSPTYADVVSPKSPPKSPEATTYPFKYDKATVTPLKVTVNSGSSGSLEGGSYSIKVLSTNYSIGRRRVENRSLLPKQIVAYDAPHLQSPRWVVKPRGDGTYKLSVSTGHTGAAQSDKLVAYLIKEPEIENWVVTPRPQHGEGIFTIEKADRSAGWTVTQEEVQQEGGFKIVKVLPLVSNKMSPPQFRENQLFKFDGIGGFHQVSPTLTRPIAQNQSSSGPLSNGTYSIKVKGADLQIGRDPTPDRSLFPRRIQTLTKTYADTPKWKLEKLSADKYRLAVGKLAVGTTPKKAVVAYQTEEERPYVEDWIITPQPQHGKGIYTVEKGDHSAGWTLSEEEASEGGQ